MVTLDTLRKLHEHDRELAAYCPTCRRWAVLDLERLIAEGRGAYCAIGRKPRCKVCGGPMQSATWRTGNLEPWESARRGAGRRGPDVARSNGMDAPARCGITCAR